MNAAAWSAIIVALIGTPGVLWAISVNRRSTRTEAAVKTRLAEIEQQKANTADLVEDRTEIRDLRDRLEKSEQARTADRVTFQERLDAVESRAGRDRVESLRETTAVWALVGFQRDEIELYRRLWPPPPAEPALPARPVYPTGGLAMPAREDPR